MHNALSRKISHYFSRKREVECVYLFGSLAAQKGKVDSDVDLGIVLREGLAHDAYADLRLAYTVEIDELLGRTADILILNNANTFLKHHVLKTGVRLYESKKRRGRNFEAHALIEYFDFKPFYDLMMRSVMQRVRKG